MYFGYNRERYKLTRSRGAKRRARQHFINTGARSFLCLCALFYEPGLLDDTACQYCSCS